jgi:hypothetical protein
MVYLPDWLTPLLGTRERAIADHPDSRCLCVDRDGTRLPPYQRLIEMPDGESFTIDGHRRAIIN